MFWFLSLYILGMMLFSVTIKLINALTENDRIQQQMQSIIQISPIFLFYPMVIVILIVKYLIDFFDWFTTKITDKIVEITRK